MNYIPKLNEKIERQRVIQSIMEKAKELEGLRKQIAELEAQVKKENK